DTLGKPDHDKSLNDEIHAKNIDKIQTAFSDISTEEYVKATIFVQLPSIVEYVSHLPSETADKFADFCHHAVLNLELIGTEVDPITGCENITPKAPAYHSTAKDEVYTPVAKDDKTKDRYKPPEVEFAKYVAYIEIKPGFGKVGAVQVENEHRTEMHVIDIVLERFPEMSQQTISCNSWVHPKSVNSESRVFFTNKSYLPSQTPSGLKRLREYELEILRGDTKPKEKRLPHERIYDYDIYNDLGDPGNFRPSLGGSEEFPYPRRCRTGSLIARGGSIVSLFKENVYVPRDETFSELKLKEFGFRTLYTLLHHLIPPLETKFINDDKEYPFITAINRLFNEEIKCPDMQQRGGVQDVVHRFIRDASDSAEKVFRFELPQIFERDAFSWFKDEEFARQTLAGMNPLSIKRVTISMLNSILEQKICGKFESVLTEQLLDNELKRRYHMTLRKAVEENKLFIIDYHDAFMPYVNRVSELEGRNLYASRTLFIYDDDEALKPLAIELTRPPTKENPVPLRAHCCTEPYIIAANRHLSAMHPIYRLLHPHFRYTMEINALARLALVNADGIIERTFSPGKYCLEMSSAIYKSEWQFDREALPADLLHRGMAVEDPSAEHGVRLIIDDYPYAKDA
uniref:Lipoxygenase n=1 Tax=Chenopodium quinoa TaxID=63459 RepID=A0A803NE81_CHEQI